MTTKNAGEKEQGMSEGPYKVGYQRGYHTVIDGSGVIVYSDDTSGGVNMFADAANYAHAHATDAAARRVRELEEALEWILSVPARPMSARIRADTTEEMCRIAKEALAGKERSDGAE